MTPAEVIERMVQRDTAASGVPLQVEDPLAARQVAQHLTARAPERPR